MSRASALKYSDRIVLVWYLLAPLVDGHHKDLLRPLIQNGLSVISLLLLPLATTKYTGLWSQKCVSVLSDIPIVN